VPDREVLGADVPLDPYHTEEFFIEELRRC
jgi:hypothetical protein